MLWRSLVFSLLIHIAGGGALVWLSVPSFSQAQSSKRQLVSVNLVNFSDLSGPNSDIQGRMQEQAVKTRSTKLPVGDWAGNPKSAADVGSEESLPLGGKKIMETIEPVSKPLNSEALIVMKIQEAEASTEDNPDRPDGLADASQSSGATVLAAEDGLSDQLGSSSQVGSGEFRDSTNFSAGTPTASGAGTEQASCWRTISSELDRRAKIGLPPSARRRGLVGEVVVRFSLDPRGLPQGELIESYSGPKLLVGFVTDLLSQPLGKYCPGEGRWRVAFDG